MNLKSVITRGYLYGNNFFKTSSCILTQVFGVDFNRKCVIWTHFLGSYSFSKNGTLILSVSCTHKKYDDCFPSNTNNINKLVLIELRFNTIKNKPFIFWYIYIYIYLDIPMEINKYCGKKSFQSVKFFMHQINLWGQLSSNG